MTLPAPRQARPCKPLSLFVRNGVGTGIVWPRHARPPDQRPGTVYFFPQKGSAVSEPGAGGKKVNCPLRPNARLSFPLLDPLRQPFRHRRRYVPQQSVPRILFFDGGRPAPLPPPPSPDDPLDATRLALRLQALGRVLDDLPAQARRFARWRARRDACRDACRDAAGTQSMSPHTQNGKRRNACRLRRLSPLKPGRPPGSRRRDWLGPDSKRRPSHEVHEVLHVTHGLAFWALERHDTS